MVADTSTNLQLPFKPFTLEESATLAGYSATAIEQWLHITSMPLQKGCGVEGLNLMQVFALFSGKRWRDEGATPSMVKEIIDFTFPMDQHAMELEFARGLTFPVTRSQAEEVGAPLGMLVPAPNTRGGKMLNLKVLWEEFKDKLVRMFPVGTKLDLS